MADKPKKLLDRVRDKLRLKNDSYATEKTYVGWIRRYILFHQKRHPAEMGKAEIEAFLTHLAVEGNVAPSTQNQALHALCCSSIGMCWSSRLQAMSRRCARVNGGDCRLF